MRRGAPGPTPPGVAPSIRPSDAVGRPAARPVLPRRPATAATTATTAHRTRSGGGSRSRAVVAIAIIILILVLVNSGGDDDSSTTTTRRARPSSRPPTTEPSTTTTERATTTTATTAPPAPTIASFTGPDNVSCTSDTTVQLSWSTENASRTTISIDGAAQPGSFGAERDAGPAVPVLGELARLLAHRVRRQQPHRHPDEDGRRRRPSPASTPRLSWRPSSPRFCWRISSTRS